MAIKPPSIWPSRPGCVGGSTVHGHNAEVDSAHQEGQHQAAQIIDQEDGAEVQAVERRIGKEDASSGAWLQLVTRADSTPTKISSAMQVMKKTPLLMKA